MGTLVDRRSRRGLVAVLAIAAVLAGVTPSGAADRSHVTARAAEGVPHPMPAPGVPNVAFIGDSIGRDAKHYVRAQVQRTHHVSYYNAIAAGYIGYHLPRLLPVIRPANGPDILLVELGTGDAFWDHSSAHFEADVRNFLDQVLPYVTCVRWFDQKPTANVAYPEVNEHRTAFNAILARVLAEPQYASQNVALVNYAAWYRMAGDQGYFLADLLHHTDKGRRELGLLAGQAAEGCDPATTGGPFWDVADRLGMADAVGWAGVSGIVDPYRNGTFRASLGSFHPTVDRGQVADMLWRMAGSPNTGPPTWTDVLTSASLRKATGWLQHEHIVLGYDDNTFRPTQPVTRGDLATFLWRWAGSPVVAPSHAWNDVPAALANAVNWAESLGILSGFPDGGFHPGSVLMRGPTIKALFAFHLGVPHPPGFQADEALPPTTTTVVVPPPSTVPPASGPSTVPSTTTPTITTPTTTSPTTPLPTTVPPTTIPPTTIPPTTLLPSVPPAL